MDTEPTDEDLRAFINAMLSNLDKRLREREVIDEAISAHRDMWVKLYRAGAGIYNDGSDEPSATPP